MKIAQVAPESVPTKMYGGTERVDKEKKPCDVVTSIAGPSLFSGIAIKDQARKIAKSLVKENMISGWE